MTKDKEIEELKATIAVLESEIQKEKKNPYENPPEWTISLVRQSDGNWKGWTRKRNLVISERQYDPQIVLQLLLVHG